jgi:hypothetical protein
LLAEVQSAESKIAAWEPRQIPYEHPKEYDPITLDTPWCSGAALSCGAPPSRASAASSRASSCTARTWTFRGGCAPRGWRLGYRPRLGVVHRTIATLRR